MIVKAIFKNENYNYFRDKTTSKEIHNQVRSMVDFPTANTFICGKNVKIIETKVASVEKTNKKIAEVIN